MKLAMTNGFSELNEKEMLQVDGGDLVIGLVALATSLILGGSLFAGCQAGKKAGREQFEAELEEEKYKSTTPTPCPTPTPTPCPTPTPMAPIYV